MTPLLLTLCLLLSSVAPETSEAESVLKNAINAQNAEIIAGSIEDMTVKLFLQRREDGSRIELDVERIYEAPDRLWTRVEERALSGARYQQGYDGKNAWLFDEVKEETILYRGPDFRTDRERIQADLEMMRQLVKFFFLANLVSGLSEVELVSEESESNGEAYMVRGRGSLTDSKTDEVKITLWIEKGTYHLVGARLEEDDGSSLQFSFRNHSPNAQGILIPGSIRLYRNDEKKPSEVIAIEGEETEDGEFLNRILFNQGVKEDLFKAPEHS